MRRHTHRSEVSVGTRTIVIETDFEEGSPVELITKYAENDMTTEQKRAPAKGVSMERSARDEASLARQISASHLGAVHELLGQAVDDGQDIQTARNLRSKGQVLEPQGMLLAFCLRELPDEETLVSRRVPRSWLDTAQRVDSIASATAEAFGGVSIHQIIVHGETQSAFLLTGSKGTRACIVDSSQAPSDNAIVARLEAIQCAQ